MQATTVSKKTPVKRPHSSSVEELVGMNKLPSVKKAVSAKKHKAASVEISEQESSEIEVSETTPVPVISKAKRKYMSSKKDAIALGEPVVITSKQTGASMRHLPARKLSFGSIKAEDEEVGPGVGAAINIPSSSTVTTKRIRRPTEKAIASRELSATFDALDDDENSSDPPLSILPIKKTKKSKNKGSKSMPKKPIIELNNRDSDATPETPPAIKKGKSSALNKGKKKAVAKNESSLSDNGEQNDQPDVDHKPSTPSDWQPTSLSDSNTGPAPDSKVDGFASSHDGQPDHDSDPVDDSEPSTPSTSKNLHKAKLPRSATPTAILFNYRDLKKPDSIDSSSENWDIRVNYATISKDLPPLAAKSLLSGVKFKFFSPFINLAHASVDETDVNSYNHLILRGKGQPAISLISGWVMSCNVVVPAHNQGGYAVKKITILPFDHEYNAYINYLGIKYKRHNFYGPVVMNTHLSISSRREGAPNFSSSARESRTPVKIQSKYTKRPKAQPEASASNVIWYHRPLPLQLDYEVTIPIYDARAWGFGFDATSFNNLRQLPLYRKSGVKHPAVSDLPEGSIVTVGHTISSFTDRDNPEALILSLNLHFVILLGILKTDA